MQNSNLQPGLYPHWGDLTQEMLSKHLITQKLSWYTHELERINLFLKEYNQVGFRVIPSNLEYLGHPNFSGTVDEDSEGIRYTYTTIIIDSTDFQIQIGNRTYKVGALHLLLGLRNRSQWELEMVETESQFIQYLDLRILMP